MKIIVEVFVNCINVLFILGFKGRELRNGTFMFFVIFCFFFVEVGKIWVDICYVVEDNSSYLCGNLKFFIVNVYNLYIYFVYMMREKIKIYIFIKRFKYFV